MPWLILDVTAFFLITQTIYHNDPKFSDQVVRVNSADQDQTAP